MIKVFFVDLFSINLQLSINYLSTHDANQVVCRVAREKDIS